MTFPADSFCSSYRGIPSSGISHEYQCAVLTQLLPVARNVCHGGDWTAPAATACHSLHWPLCFVADLLEPIHERIVGLCRLFYHGISHEFISKAHRPQNSTADFFPCFGSVVVRTLLRFEAVNQCNQLYGQFNVFCWIAFPKLLYAVSTVNFEIRHDIAQRLAQLFKQARLVASLLLRWFHRRFIP